jgi:hypothetical protein
MVEELYDAMKEDLCKSRQGRRRRGCNFRVGRFIGVQEWP